MVVACRDADGNKMLVAACGDGVVIVVVVGKPSDGSRG